MVCIYCAHSTRVVNSRHQKRANQIWRRRRCTDCKAIFTSLEGVDNVLAVRVIKNGHLEPFSRDKLLLAIHDSLKHRKTAVADASYLTGTILGSIYTHLKDATIDSSKITQITLQTLGNFDKAAATHYRAFHE